MKPRSAVCLDRLNELVDLVETGEVMPCLERGWAGGQAVTAWQLDRPGDIAEGNKPVSFNAP